MDGLLERILDFKELLFLGVAVGAVFFAFFSVSAGNITWKSRNTRILGLFMGMNVREMLWLSVGAVRILFVICVSVFTLRLGVGYLAFYAALFLLSAFTFFGFPRILIELINTVAVYVSLTALGILIGYFRDVNNEPMIFVIYVLLSLFTVLYSVYFYLKSVSDMVRGKLGLEERRVPRR
ncbi:hypothetical protein AGMMS49983_16260 [Clostridia bacterium]|nr:hypothetical protein AGMMS49983_16260 [Clostridia bacterium]